MSERSKRLKWRLGSGLTAGALLVAIVMVVTAMAGPIGAASGFEDDDGNLVDNAAAGIDWNTFSPTTWTGTAPYRTTEKTVSGWKFAGIEDDQTKNSDTGFAGGTKQDDDCASVIGSKAPNKDDLKRIYLASKTVPVTVSGVTSDHVFLNLAWVRITQNTTSPSAHVAFEFNKGTTPCGAGSDGLVERTVGDMLIVYDFQGGSGDIPRLTLRRWVDSGSCEISSNTAPCWGLATNLTTSGFAEAKVNTDAAVADTIGPTSPTSVQLGLSEFGEAGIDLTAAGVFTAGTCESFGKAYGVSRSSGNSGTAQMKDLVGPGNFNLQNCGTVKIIKRTDPRGLNQDFDFTSNLAGAQLSCTTDTSPASFKLNDNGNTTADSTGNTESCTNVPAGSYTVTEGANPAGFTFDSVTCTSSGGAGATTSGKVASITMVGGGSVTCVYVNKQQLGAIKISKTDSKTGNALAGAEFDIRKKSDNSLVAHVTTGADGTVCQGDLAFGDYTVTETAAPNGYKIDKTTATDVSVVANGACGSGNEVTASFTDTPLSDIQVRFRDGGSGVTSATITCDNATGTTDLTDTQAWDDTTTISDIEAPTKVTCTIDIDP
jgi:hypothetical protein